MNIFLALIVFIFLIPVSSIVAGETEISRGIRKLELGEYLEAADCFQRILEENPGWIDGYRLVSAAYALMGDRSRAGRYYARYEQLKSLKADSSSMQISSGTDDTSRRDGGSTGSASSTGSVSLKIGPKSTESKPIGFGTIDLRDGMSLVPEFLMSGKTSTLFKSASEAGEPSGEVVHGENVEILARKDIFVQVEKLNGTRGWLRRSLVKENPAPGDHQ